MKTLKYKLVTKLRELTYVLNKWASQKIEQWQDDEEAAANADITFEAFCKCRKPVRKWRHKLKTFNIPQVDVATCQLVTPVADGTPLRS